MSHSALEAMPLGVFTFGLTSAVPNVSSYQESMPSPAKSSIGSSELCDVASTQPLQSVSCVSSRPKLGVFQFNFPSTQNLSGNCESDPDEASDLISSESDASEYSSSDSDFSDISQASESDESELSELDIDDNIGHNRDSIEISKVKRSTGRPRAVAGSAADTQRNAQKRIRYVERKREALLEADWRNAVAAKDNKKADELQQLLLPTVRGRQLFPSQTKTFSEHKALSQLASNVRECSRCTACDREF